MKDKKFTWRDLHRAASKIPAHLWNEPVVIWTEDEKAYTVADVEVLKEDHHFDGDEGCAPKSVLKESIAEDPDEYRLIYKKGTRILYAQ
jgi:hypothetical protein